MLLTIARFLPCIYGRTWYVPGDIYLQPPQVAVGRRMANLHNQVLVPVSSIDSYFGFPKAYSVARGFTLRG